MPKENRKQLRRPRCELPVDDLEPPFRNKAASKLQTNLKGQDIAGCGAFPTVTLSEAKHLWLSSREPGRD